MVERFKEPLTYQYARGRNRVMRDVGDSGAVVVDDFRDDSAEKDDHAKGGDSGDVSEQDNP